MSGLGFKDFQVGEVLTSADVDGYLMQQSVMRFADSGARGSALGTAAGSGVPLAEGMVSYLDDTDAVEVYDGTTWRSTGLIGQVVQTVKTDVFTDSSVAGGASTSVTGLTASITPKSASNKILVVASVNASGNLGANAGLGIILYRGATALGLGDASSSRGRTTSMSGQEANQASSNLVVIYLDSPATTSSTTYSVDLINGSTATAILHVNRTGGDVDNSGNLRSSSSLTLVEVKA